MAPASKLTGVAGVNFFLDPNPVFPTWELFWERELNLFLKDIKIGKLHNQNSFYVLFQLKIIQVLSFELKYRFTKKEDSHLEKKKFVSTTVSLTAVESEIWRLFCCSNENPKRA